jgi:hypothetical protein
MVTPLKSVGESLRVYLHLTLPSFSNQKAPLKLTIKQPVNFVIRKHNPDLPLTNNFLGEDLNEIKYVTTQ